MSYDGTTTAIRLAAETDLPGILAIYNEAVLYSSASYDLEPVSLEDRRAWYRARVDAGFPVTLAELDGQIVGFGSYGTFRAKPGYRFTVEHSLYIGSAWRGRGIGSAILADLVLRARAAGYHAMIGGVDSANQGSLRFHQAQGFVEIGRLREVGRKFDRWLDLIFVELIL
ncbi:MAG: N-acetyltransferase [Oscillochloris sp.]|nr:N-acetyltransferase [Oscillochloris sp.]